MRPRPIRRARAELVKAIPLASKERLKSTDVIKTYRYLRLGMIGAVVLLAASIVIERFKVDCWQTSISAYYYTPVRAIFVGAMLAVGFALIVYKGRGALEDFFLNIAGMLAPIVAVAPTTDVGRCWSIPPSPPPVVDGSLAPWVAVNVDNNFYALLIAGAIGVVVAAVIALKLNRDRRGPEDTPRPPEEKIDGWTMLSLAITALALVAGWWLIRNWSNFDTRAHGFSAVLLFVFLILAIIVKVIEHRKERDRAWFWVYALIAVLMVVGGIGIAKTRTFKDHTVFVLEAWEIVLFAVYWIFQTVENWDEKPAAPQAAGG